MFKSFLKGRKVVVMNKYRILNRELAILETLKQYTEKSIFYKFRKYGSITFNQNNIDLIETVVIRSTRMEYVEYHVFLDTDYIHLFLNNHNLTENSLLLSVLQKEYHFIIY